MTQRSVPSSTAVLHDQVRPGWSAGVIHWLLGCPKPGKRLSVLDLGAGTGLGTRAMAHLGHNVTAVDTEDHMLAVLVAENGQLPHRIAGRISVVKGSAEQLPLQSSSFDAIVCLQAWHWVDQERAVYECNRVLAPDGTVGLAWHTWDRSSPWVQALAAIVEPDGTPPDQTSTAPHVFATRGSFERQNFPFNYELNVDQLIRLASSWSFVSQRPDRASVLAEIHRLGRWAASPDTGLLRFPHITAAYRLQKRGSSTSPGTAKS